MKDDSIVKMAIILMFVGAVSAGILAVVHGFTGPIIEQRMAEQFQEAVGSFLPESETFGTEALEDMDFVLGYDAAGKLEGVVATARYSGYGGVVEYNLAVSAAGGIIGMRIVDHLETPGIGDIITKPEFQDTIIGKKVEDPVQIGVDVDTVSGATVSTRALLLSIREVLNVIGANFLGPEV